MLRELQNVLQIEGEPHRRWFHDDTFDLIVWQELDGHVEGFQLCYREGSDERALTWWRGRGFTHKRIDAGEDGRPKKAPILVPDGTFDRDRVLMLFEQECRELDPEIVGFVMRTAGEYPGGE